MSENAILGALRRLGLPARVRRCLTSAEASSAVCIILIRTANDLCPPATRRAEALRCRRELKTADNEARCLRDLRLVNCQLLPFACLE